MSGRRRTEKVHERTCGSRHSLHSALRSPMRTKHHFAAVALMAAFNPLRHWQIDGFVKILLLDDVEDHSAALARYRDPQQYS